MAVDQIPKQSQTVQMGQKELQRRFEPEIALRYPGEENPRVQKTADEHPLRYPQILQD